jgi:hypothetical protein
MSLICAFREEVDLTHVQLVAHREYPPIEASRERRGHGLVFSDEQPSDPPLDRLIEV